jgi:hypothetical protein
LQKKEALFSRQLVIAHLDASIPSTVPHFCSVIM